MNERLCAVRKRGDPSMACQLPAGHGGSRRVGRRIIPVHDYAPTVEVLRRMEWMVGGGSVPAGGATTIKRPRG